MSDILIVIPCYNEAQRLDIESFREFFNQNNNISFLFVNDGSSDNTLAILRDLSNDYENVSHLDLKKNVGKAEAIRAGVNHSQGLDFEYIGYFDADLAAPLEEIKNLEKNINEKNEPFMLLGTRIKLLGTTDIKRKLLRHYIGRVFATIVSNMLKMPIYDTQCGAKLIRKDIAKIIFKNKFISKWLFDVELLFRLKTEFSDAENKIIEIPLKRWEDKSGSKIKPSYYIKAPLDLISIFFSYRSKKKTSPH